MTLYEWLEKLQSFDPDDWGEIKKLRSTFTDEDLEKDLELKITFVTKAGTVDHVTIQLLDYSDNVIVDLDYEILQLDVAVLAELIGEAAFLSDETQS